MPLALPVDPDEKNSRPGSLGATEAAVASTRSLDTSLPRSRKVRQPSMAPVAEGVRRCADCDAPVYDFTGLSRRQIVARVRAHGGSVCGQVVARSDGRLVFGACTADDGGRVRGGLTLTSRG